MEQSDLDLLQIIPSNHIQAVVRTRRLGVDMKGISVGDEPLPVEVRADIASHLFDSTSIKAALNGLDEIRSLILRELVDCGGRANSRDLALYFTCAGLLTSKKVEDTEAPRGYVLSAPYPVAHPHGLFEQALRQLIASGLLFWSRQTSFAGRDYTSGVHDGVLIVPQAVIACVQQTASAREGVVDDGTSEGALALQRQLYLYWSLVAAQREGLSLVGSGLLARSSLRLVLEQLGERSEHERVRQEHEVPRLLFLRLLLQQLGLVQIRQNAILALPGAADFFTLPFLERARRCYHLYLDTPFWNEMLYLSEVNVSPGPATFEPAHREIVRSRHLLCARLLHRDLTQWQDLTAFIVHTKLHIPYLLFPRGHGPRAERYFSGGNPYGWDFHLRRGWLTHREGWLMVEGGFIRSILTGPLYWLGLVELGNVEHPATFRLASGAQDIFDDQEPVTQDVAWGKLIAQPNFELIALAPVSERLLLSLDGFAERTSLEHAAQYRLTRASVTGAIQKGLSAEAILSELESAADGPIPQNVRYSVGEWERQARRVEVWRSATLLEVDDEELLNELCSDPQTRDLFQKRLSASLVEVAHQRLPDVLQLLWQRGYLPAITVAPTEPRSLDSREPQWQLHTDGSLRPLYPVLNLYLVEEAAHFCERESATGELRVSATSLRRAQEDGRDLAYIIRFLQQYCEGGIPADLLIRLKLWGGGYGPSDILVEQSPMLRLPEPVLRDIQADTELNALLNEEVDAQSRLVRVSSHNLEHILRLLRERGFDIN